MRNIRLDVAYDGTAYSGWQRQADNRSIQGALEDSLEKMLGQAPAVIGSGRTDAGVHARGQVANFRTENVSVPGNKFAYALNSLLPRDIRVMASRVVHDEFHSRFDAYRREYQYYVYVGEFCPPEKRLYCHQVRRAPDLTRLNSYCAYLPGERDFSTFAAAGDQSKSRFRYVYGAGFRPKGEYLVFSIAANAFLWKMIRSLVGTMLAFDRAGTPAEAFGGALSARERGAAGETAPARGLFFERVYFHEQ